MKTVNIKGKEYIEVNERLKYFREHYATYSLTSEILHMDTDWVCMRASIADPEGRIIATGTAYERANSTYINKTSYIENCETSAWGRALGNFGIGIDTAVATAEEVQNAVLNQDEAPNQTWEYTDEHREYIATLIKETKSEVALFCTYIGADNLDSLTKEQYDKGVRALHKKVSQLDEKEAR